MGDIWCLVDSSSATDTLPVSRSEKKPLESISAAYESAMELEEIIDEGMLYTPVSWQHLVVSTQSTLST